jgi:FecR protein
MRMSSWAKIAGFFILAFAFSSAGPALAEGKIGVAATVQNQVFGNSQPLAAGSGVFANERIRTGEASAAQLQFIDQTNLSIGPKSEVVLDRFVYNSDHGKGSVVIETGKGVFRFVSGSQDPTSYQIKTPVATIGVRGTMFTQINGSFYATVATSGTLFVHNNVTGVNIVINPGWTLIIYPNGQTEMFQSVDTLQTWLQHIDPVLVNEFQQLFQNLTFLNALGNTFTPAPPRNCGDSC